MGYVGAVHIVYIPCSMNGGARLQLELGLGTFLGFNFIVCYFKIGSI